MTLDETVDVVLFDLGGVLVDLGGMPEFKIFAGGGDSEDDLWRRWLECPWVRRFERGLCDADSFSRGMVDSWSMTVGPEEFLKAFAAWPLSRCTRAGPFDPPCLASWLPEQHQRAARRSPVVRVWSGRALRRSFPFSRNGTREARSGRLRPRRQSARLQGRTRALPRRQPDQRRRRTRRRAAIGARSGHRRGPGDPGGSRALDDLRSPSASGSTLYNTFRIVYAWVDLARRPALLEHAQ